MSDPNLQAVVFREEERWVVQCLEHDIATQADSMDGLYDKLEGVLSVYLRIAAEEGTAPFDGVPPAPQRYWEMYRRARLRLQPVQTDRGLETAHVPVELRAVA